MRLAAGATGKRAVICEQLELENLTFPFDLEIWYGDRVAVLGANGTGKSISCGCSPRGVGARPGRAAGRRSALAPVAHGGVARLGARVRPGHFSQTHDRPT
jgi:ATPase subunit of ABC transporter with duplicated ATPase domains